MNLTIELYLKNKSNLKENMLLGILYMLMQFCLRGQHTFIKHLHAKKFWEYSSVSKDFLLLTEKANFWPANTFSEQFCVLLDKAICGEKIDSGHSNCGF